VGANIIYGEEAAYLSTALFYEMIVPMLNVAGTSLICISSPRGRFNVYSELLDTKLPDGTPMFHVVKVNMMCDACRAQGKEEHECKHAPQPPPWKNIENQERTRLIYGAKTTMFRREILGQITDEGGLAFAPDSLVRFFQRSRFEERHDTPRYIYVALDPNGGGSCTTGAGSHSAIVSFFYDHGQIIVSWGRVVFSPVPVSRPVSFRRAVPS
jgi:hypothetical protein